jgi:hypothetical protein
MGAAGPTGVALIPGTAGQLGVAKIPTVPPSTASCSDPWLSSDLGGPLLPSGGLCWHAGGAVMHSNETFDLAWDPLRRDLTTTRHYLEQFLRNVADASGTLTSPYALTTQYNDPSGRAGNSSLYGGGCIDYGNPGGFTCQFGNTTGSGVGSNYPTSGCPVAGTNQFAEDVNGFFTDAPNDICLTDAQLQRELATMIGQEGLLDRKQPGYTPLVVLMTPPGVETCLDATGKLCSANSRISPPVPIVSTAVTGGTIPAGTYEVEVTYVTAAGETLASASQSVATTGAKSTITISSPPAANGATGWFAYVAQGNETAYTRQQPAGSPTAIGTSLTLATPPTSTGTLVDTSTAPSFCSYHSQVNVGGTQVAYVVLPWVAWWNDSTDCTEPDALPATTANQAGVQLVDPLSQAHIAALVNPGLNGWFGLSDISNPYPSEINDNGCTPLGSPLDDVTIGGTGYALQREFNNAGVVQTDQNTPKCALTVDLAPAFVVPSAVDQGDVVEFDGSKTDSTLIVPKAGYVWSFGDGKNAVGPSVVHTYAKGGTYTVTLTVTDRGGNVRSLSQTISVLGPDGKPVSSTQSNPGLHARMQLMPQSLRTALRKGVAIRVSSNEAAAGLATLSISRTAARRAHIRTGRGASVVIGRGTISGIIAGTSHLRLRLSRVTAGKLERAGHTDLTIRLALVAAGGDHLSIVAAGHY